MLQQHLAALPGLGAAEGWYNGRSSCGTSPNQAEEPKRLLSRTPTEPRVNSPGLSSTKVLEQEVH